MTPAEALNPDVGPRCPACRVGLVTHDERDPRCIDYKKGKFAVPADAVEAATGAIIRILSAQRQSDYTLSPPTLGAAAPYMLADPPMPSKGTPRHAIRIPDALWHDFQAATSEAGTNPSETIRQLVRDWLNKRKASDD